MVDAFRMNVDELQEQLNECQEHLPTGHSSLNLSNLLRKASRCESTLNGGGEQEAGERELSISIDTGSAAGERRSSRERFSSPGVTSLDRNRRESNDHNVNAGSGALPPRCSSAQPPPPVSGWRSSRDRNEHRESGSLRHDRAKGTAAAQAAPTPGARVTPSDAAGPPDGITDNNASQGTHPLPPPTRPTMSERRSASPFAVKLRTIDSDTSVVGGTNSALGPIAARHEASARTDALPAVAWNPLFEGSPSNAVEPANQNANDVAHDNEVQTAESAF